MKAGLLEAISERVRARGYNKSEAASAMGLNRTEASHLLNGNLSRFTIDRLVRALQHLDPNVYVRVTIALRERLPLTQTE